MNESRLCLGAVVGVHGIKGEVKIKSFTAVDRDIDKYGVLEDQTGTKSFSLKVVGHSKDLLRAKIKGVDDRNQAESLIGTELWIDRSRLPEPKEDEFYQADLIGLEARLEGTEDVIGTVAGIYNFGAGDIVELKLAENGKLEMLPFTKHYVPEINITERYIIVAASLADFAAEAESIPDES